MRLKATPLIALLLCTVPTFANIFRVNNTLTTGKTQKIFNTIAAAHNDSDVLPGDTLMIEGSAAPYASFTMTKPLVLLGPGYLLSQNQQTQANILPAVLYQVTIRPSASGSVLMGLTFSSSYQTYTPYIESSNITISRCYFPNPIQFTYNCSFISITQNYFANDALAVGYFNYTFNNVIFSNNYVGGKLIIDSGTEYPRLFSAVEHNVFGGPVKLTGSFFRSNVLVSPGTETSISSTSINNNLASASALGQSNGNQGLDTSAHFVGSAGNTPDTRFRVRTTSPYRTAGYNGSEPGIYGGINPYVPSGMPPIPSIYEINADVYGSRKNGLQVTIKAKSN